MTAKFAVVEEYRMYRDVGRLQPCSHLAGMKRVTVPVGIAGDKHGGRVSRTWAHLVVGRIPGEGGEILEIIRRSKLIAPEMCIVKQVISEHVQHRDHAHYRPKQIWPLGESCARQQARIRASKNGEPVRRRPSSVDQPFGCAEEVVVSCLSIASLGGLMPLSPKLGAASDVWQRKQATMLNQVSYKNAELGGHGNAVAAIRRHNCRVSSTGKNIFAAHQK